MAQYELVADLPTPEVSYLVPRLDPAMERLDPSLRRRLNAFAANLTSLLELSILSAKQPMKVVTRSLAPLSQARIYVERVPRPFFEQLAQAGQAVSGLCREMIRAYGSHPAGGGTARPVGVDSNIDFGVVYSILADLSQGGEFVWKTSEEWRTVSSLVESLKRDPNVTADAYRHVDPEEQYFLQWCTAMASFEARMTDGTPVRGAELLFVEGWNDSLVPGRKGPLTNSAWRKVLGEMALTDLKEWTLAPVP
ncbi:MAG: hypothetical protein PVG25_13270, partial [Anaerolineae bacterium]|jgi:hypothetical protein